jgi:asparagine synthase (glutamine-hydrolysing)
MHGLVVKLLQLSSSWGHCLPALKYVRGDFLEFMRDILDSQACRQRGLFNRKYIDMLLSAPEMHHTRIQGSKLWHLAVFEYWLQRNLDYT